MFTSKIRTTIVILIAALSFVSVGPMTSVTSALPKRHESPRCPKLLDLWEKEVELADQAEKEGHPAEAAIWSDVAHEDYETARALKCVWAMGRPSPSQPRKTLPTPPPIKEEPAPSKPKDVIPPPPVAGGAAG